MSTFIKILLAAVTAILSIAKELGRKDVIQSIEKENKEVREAASAVKDASPSKDKESVIHYLKNNKLSIVILTMFLCSCSSDTTVKVSFDCSFIKTEDWNEVEQRALTERLGAENKDSIIFKMASDYIAIRRQLTTCNGSKKDDRQSY